MSATDLDYTAFLAHKTGLKPGTGFKPIEIPDIAKPFQGHLCDWAIRQGAAGIYAACGLGKTLMQFVVGDNVVRHTNGKFLIVTPLAVAYQTEREARKFGFDAKVSRDGKVHPCITITNYERLHYFNPADFVGAALDESSGIKAFGGKRRKQITRFFNTLPYRSLYSGTPSPNDFIELGTQSECLGVMAQSEMLNYFFRETQYMRHTVFREGDFWNTTKWHFKPHSEQPFWRWVSSWARAVRLPSDLGFDDEGYVLPPLEYVQSIVDVPYIPPGELFPRPAVTLQEQKAEAKITTRERCEKVAELVNDGKPAIVWCQLNEEGTTLAGLIPDSIEVAGRHSDDFKEQALNDFALGKYRVLITKPKIACWGMNYQHCAHMTFFPTHSYEQFHQGISRCHRFGQKERVLVDVVSSPGEAHVIEGLGIKIEQADRMFKSLCKYMHDATAMYESDRHTQTVILPSWLGNGHVERKRYCAGD